MSAANEKRIHGYTAEFSTVPSLLAACRRVRDAGYTQTDAYTPFPVHGIDEALGIRPTVLPWIALAGGLTGTITAFTMEIWMNGINYPYIISGKPFVSLPAFVPVGFELTILLASFGAFFGMLALNKLPRFSNPLFAHPRFDAATDDKFFLFIGADDARYNEEGVRRLLADLGSEAIDPVVEDDSSDQVPRWLINIGLTVALLSVIPLLFVARMRVTTSSSPRFHVFHDMDYTPSKQTQRLTTIFADGRTMRPDVPGTVSRAQGAYDPDFYTGIDMAALALLDPDRAERLVRFGMQPPQEEAPPAEPAPAAAAEPPSEPPAAEPPAAETPATETAATETPAAEAAAQPAVPPAPVDNTPWLKKNPLTLDEATLRRGQAQFNIYCAVCHGQDGGGNGLVNVRAQQNVVDNKWVPPSNISEPTFAAAVYPDGKLFATISQGKGKMAGYAAQMKPEDRWAVVAYVRAIQLSRNAAEGDVPAAELEKLQAAP